MVPPRSFIAVMFLSNFILIIRVLRQGLSFYYVCTVPNTMEVGPLGATRIKIILIEIKQNKTDFVHTFSARGRRQKSYRLLP